MSQCFKITMEEGPEQLSKIPKCTNMFDSSPRAVDYVLHSCVLFCVIKWLLSPK